MNNTTTEFFIMFDETKKVSHSRQTSPIDFDEKETLQMVYTMACSIENIMTQTK
jgi:hypothetical protein